MKRFLAMLVAVLMALSLVTIPVTAEKDPEPEAVFTAGSATAEPGESFDLSIDVSGEYEAHLQAKEKGVTVIELTLSVPDEDTASAICANWQKKNQDIYQYLIRQLF